MVVVILTIIHCDLIAQPIQSEQIPNRAKRFYDQSTEKLHWDQFEEASQLLLRAVEIAPNFKEAHYRLGFIFIEKHDWETAQKHFKQVIEINPDFHPNSYYGLAEAAFFGLNHDEAEKAYNQFLTFRISESRKQKVEQRLSSIEFGRKARQNPVNFKPFRIDSPVSTSTLEYFPVLTADSRMLFFTRMDNDKGFMFENVYVAFKTETGWNEAYSLGAPINTNENEALNSISPDGRTIYLTMCNRQGNFGTCDIYTADRTGNRWSRPRNMGATINSRSWDGHPTISADGKTLIFSSTRSGGYGGQDLWMSQKDSDGNWKTPVNLGEHINTSGDEKTPFLHFDNQTLYFTSDGLPGIGGEDIFKSRLVDGKWQKPVNLGYPINSVFDDSGFFVTASGDTAFFATNRFDNKKVENIYAFELPENLRPEPVSWIAGTIRNRKNEKPLEAAVEIYDLQTGKLTATVNSDASTGSFLIPLPVGGKYAYHSEAEGFLFYSAFFDTKKNAQEGVLLNIAMEPIEAGAEFTLRNVFFDHDAYDLDPLSKTELLRLIRFLNQHKQVKVEVRGHTDNVGRADYNQKLSERRAQSVKAFLTENGIDKNRLTAKGFGETMPVADNESEEGRAKNRRTTVKIAQ